MSDGLIRRLILHNGVLRFPPRRLPLPGRVGPKQALRSWKDLGASVFERVQAEAARADFQ